MRPLHWSDKIDGKRLTKVCSNQDEKNSWLSKCCIYSKVIEALVIKAPITDIFLIIGINNPIEWHTPEWKGRVISTYEDQAAKTEEKNVELPWTTAAHDEASSLTVFVNLIIKG